MSTNPQRHADLCDAFEQAWQTNPGVELVDFLRPFNEVISGEVITDLIAIDMEFRLRENAFETRKVEDYLAEFGER